MKSHSYDFVNLRTAGNDSPWRYLLIFLFFIFINSR